MSLFLSKKKLSDVGSEIHLVRRNMNDVSIGQYLRALKKIVFRLSYNMEINTKREWDQKHAKFKRLSYKERVSCYSCLVSYYHGYKQLFIVILTKNELLH